MAATIRQIVDDAEGIIGEVAGAGVQTYSEDRLMADTIRGFNLLFKKYHWDQYLQWHTLVLDGVLGIVTTDALETVLDFEDISSVHRDKEEAPLPVLPRKRNPSGRIATGSTAIAWTSLNVTDTNYAKRKIQFYPKTSVGSVNICARHYPLDILQTQWDWEDVMYLDRDMLAYSAAYMTLMSDDLNANAAELAKSMMEEKFRTITGALSNHPLALGVLSYIPTRWRENF